MHWLRYLKAFISAQCPYCLAFKARPLTHLDGALSNHGAVDLINNAIDLLHVETVRHELIARNDILLQHKFVSLVAPSYFVRFENSRLAKSKAGLGVHC